MLNKNTLLIILLLITLSLAINRHFAGYLENLFFNMSSFTDSQQTKRQGSVATPADSRLNTGGDKVSVNTPPTELFKKTKVIVDPCRSTEFVERTSNKQKYYELNTNLGEGYEGFLAELELRLNSVFLHFEQRLGITLDKSMKLNFVFQTTRQDYENYSWSLGKSPIGNQGRYISEINLSIVEMKSKEQAMTVAVHEAIHAFNFIYWGRTWRFFNEGMAEYSEFVAADGTLSTFNFSYLKHQSHPMEIPIILAYEGDWHIGNHYELYENSKALFYFLMSHEVGRQVISKIMTLETENYCSGLSKDRIEDILEGYLPNFEQEFDYWFSDNLYIFLN